jgi:hypothetical protein
MRGAEAAESKLGKQPASKKASAALRDTHPYSEQKLMPLFPFDYTRDAYPWNYPEA